MKKAITLLLTTMLLFGACACADNYYLIPDSDTRELTKSELWKWDCEALGYILNEIFARHGYHFEEGGKYQAYFENQDWYEENTQYATNQEIYANLLTTVEWKNERLVKDVREEMRAMDTTNPSGRSIYDASDEAEIRNGFAEFVEIKLGGNRKLAVYSGPGKAYYRGANGKAMVSTNGKVYAAGYDGDWLMVMYWTNGGSVRIGYTSYSDVRQKVDLPDLNFSWVSASVSKNCTLTDDPVMSNTQIAKLQKGQTVTFLGFYENNQRWAYIETDTDGKPVRGFMSPECLKIN